MGTARRRKRAGARPAARSRRASGAGGDGTLVEAFREAPTAVALFDGRLRCVRANRAFAVLSGRTAARLRGRSLEAALPADPPGLDGAAREVLADGRSRLGIAAHLRRGDRPPCEVEVSLYRVGARPAALVAIVREVAALWPAAASGRPSPPPAERFAERLARLQDVTAALSASATEADVARSVFEKGLHIVGASGGSLSFPAGDDLVHVAHAFGSLARRGGAPAVHPESLRVPLAEAFRSQAPVWIGSAEALVARYPRLVEPGQVLSEGAWAAVPLTVQGRPLGVLGVAFAGVHAFEEEERAFVVALAQLAAQAIERARLFEVQKHLRAQAEQAADERESLVKELRRTLRERDESMALLDALFENAPVGLGLLDREMRYVRVNAKLAAMNGAPPEQHAGRTLWEVAPAAAGEEQRKAAEPLLRDFREVLETRTPVLDRAVEGIVRPGPPRSFLLSWFPVLVGERLIGVGTLVRDVTEQRRAEQFQRQLLGVVGHDLRSPLMAITASAELLQSGPLGEREARSAGRILRAAYRIDGIIRALVDFTMVQVGSGIPLHRQPTDLVPVARTVAEETEAAHPGRAVRVEGVGSLAGTWDPDRVGQALANLVGNAVQYSPEGSPVVLCCGETDGEAWLEVRNAGEPIPAELLPRLFEPFQRGSDERTQRRKGLGLGLYIAREIALAHAGRIEVRSSAGEGTRVALYLPRAAVA